MSFDWWDRIVEKKAVRNDFMSHVSYVVLILFATMLVASWFDEGKTAATIAGAVMAVAATGCRELWDQAKHGSAEVLDIVAGLLAGVFCEICLHWF